MNARRKHLIKKVMDAFRSSEVYIEDVKYKDFKKHLETFTDEEIEQELALIERKNNEKL